VAGKEIGAAVHPSRRSTSRRWLTLAIGRHRGGDIGSVVALVGGE
jgi:hypothetical protein